MYYRFSITIKNSNTKYQTLINAKQKLQLISSSIFAEINEKARNRNTGNKKIDIIHINSITSNIEIRDSITIKEKFSIARFKLPSS